MTTKEWLTKQHIELIKDIPTENILAAAWDCGKTPCPRCEHREKTCNKHNIGATAIGLALIRLEELHAKEKETIDEVSRGKWVYVSCLCKKDTFNWGNETKKED